MTRMVSRSRPHVGSRQEECLLAMIDGIVLSSGVRTTNASNCKHDQCSEAGRSTMFVAGACFLAKLGQRQGLMPSSARRETHSQFSRASNLEVLTANTLSPTTRTFTRYVFLDGDECPSESQEEQSRLSARMKATLLLLCNKS